MTSASPPKSGHLFPVLDLSGYADGMKYILIHFVALVIPALAADISGVPHIVDGDTLHLNGTKIRLYGIDAHETR